MAEVAGAKAPKGSIDLEGLSNELEQEKVIRDHLRSSKDATLFPEGCNESVKSCCVDHVHAVLKVLLLRTALVEGHPQPAVKELRDELELLYKKCGGTVDEGIVTNDSWCIRKFLSFIKMKVRKQIPSTAPCCNRLHI